MKTACHTLVFVACCVLANCGSPRDYWAVGIGQQGVAGQPEVSTAQYSAMLNSKQSFEKWLHAEVAGDQFGKTQMAMTGEAQLIPNGTRLLVTDLDSLNYGEVIPISKVRILDGKYAGAAGWMAAKYVLRRP
jgi:hypothetical protein